MAHDQAYNINTFNQRFRKCQQLIRFKPTESQMNPNKINILSIDGGGYRNIISIIILMELELRSKRNISSMFNMVGGTSFGAIIASCLNYPTLLNAKKPKYMTKDILSIWNRDMPKIFTNQNLLSTDYTYYVAFMRGLRNLRSDDSRYDGQGKEKMLVNVFQMKEFKSSIRQLLIPAFSIDCEDTIWFDSSLGAQDKVNLPLNEISSENYEISDNQKLNHNIDTVTFFEAVDASTTPPKIFPLVKHPLDEGEEHKFIDGGEGKGIANKNNPAYSLVVEALRQGYKMENINVISIGSGKYDFTEHASDQEVTQIDSNMYWEDPLYNPIGRESETIHNHLQEMLPAANYVRLQPTLPSNKQYLFDGCGYDDNQELCQIACEYLQENRGLVEKALRLLI